MKIVITGATGFIGTEFIRSLPDSVSSVAILGRNGPRAKAHFERVLSPLRANKLKAYSWSAETSVAPATALDGADFVFHLAGENVGAGRWSSEIKRRILDSRKLGTRNLVTGLNKLSRPPALLSASAVGFYGNTGDTSLTEESPQGDGFLAEVCGIWESEARKANVSRLITPRLAVVLGPDGGALEKILPLFRAGVGGRIGDGKQWMSWIHRDDVIGFFLRALMDENVKGIYNLGSPEPIRNSRFAQVLGQVLHRPSVLPTPAFALRLAFGEMADQTILSSQRVVPAHLEALGFTFQYPNLEGALRQITSA